MQFPLQVSRYSRYFLFLDFKLSLPFVLLFAPFLDKTENTVGTQSSHVKKLFHVLELDMALIERMCCTQCPGRQSQTVHH